jgi:hypothetical protein
MINKVTAMEYKEPLLHHPIDSNVRKSLKRCAVLLCMRGSPQTNFSPALEEGETHLLKVQSENF